MSSTESHENAPRARVLGLPVDLMDADALTEAALRRNPGDSARVVANLNLHALYVARRDERMRALLESAEIVHVDGMPLVWICRASGFPAERKHRVTYIDWLPQLLRRAGEKKSRVFFVGGTREVGGLCADRIAREHPSLAFGYHHGYLDGADASALLSELRAFEPDILFVGMGMPRQEHWIWDLREDLPGVAILPCGACFDYYAGKVPTPPRVLGRLGLEWTHRLAADPVRLWQRYLLEPVVLLPFLVIDILRHRLGNGRAELG